MNILACSITTTFETYCSSAEKTLYAWSTWGNTAMVIILSVYDSFNCEMTRAVSPFHPAHLWPFKMYWDPQVENSLLIYSDRHWLINLLWYAYNGLPGWYTLDAMATQLRPEETTWLQKCHRFKQSTWLLVKQYVFFLMLGANQRTPTFTVGTLPMQYAPHHGNAYKSKSLWFLGEMFHKNSTVNA